MGLGPSLSVHNNLPRKESEMFDINDENGYLLCEKYLIPEEVLSIILSHLPPKELVFSGRRVCKYWCNVIDSLVWKLKLQRINVPPSKVNDLPWYVCYWILHKAPLGKNLVRNNCGQGKLIYLNFVFYSSIIIIHEFLFILHKILQLMCDEILKDLILKTNFFTVICPRNWGKTL